MKGPAILMKMSVLAVVSFVISSSCTQGKVDLPLTVLKPSLEITEFRDTIFVGRITDIAFHRDSYYFLDKSASSLIKTRDDFSLDTVLLAEGPGPSEIKAAFNFEILGDFIHVFDNASSSLKTFGLNGELHSYSKIPISVSTTFAVSDNAVFLSDFRSKLPIRRTTFSDSSFSNFGKERSWPNKSFGAERHIIRLPDDRILTALLVDKPILDIYDSGGKLLSSIDLSNVSFLQNSVDKYEKEVVTKRNAGMIFIRDAFFDSDKLYLLVTSHDDLGQISVNKVITCVLQGDRLSPSEVIQLDDSGYFLSIAVADQGRRLVAFDVSSNSIKAYDL